jgi:hypothetical protein
MYHRINVTNIKKEIEYLKNLEREKFFLLGIEVTDPDIEQYCALSIDPQHSPNTNKITSIEYVFQYQNDVLAVLNPFDKIFMTTIKTDIDSIGAMAILTLLLTGKFKIDGDMILRLKAIAKSDRHGRKNWKNRKEDFFHFENYNIFGLPSGLAYMTSDHKISTEDKVKKMINYLITGEFKDLMKYNNLVIKNLKRSNQSTNLQIIINKKLCFVESKHRGAIAYGYKFSPCVIAKNNYFIFGKGQTKKIGRKITIAQYEDNKFINLTKIALELNELEPGWGGSTAIIGSPIDHPTSLTDDQIIQICKRHLF